MRRALIVGLLMCFCGGCARSGMDNTKQLAFANDTVVWVDKDGAVCGTVHPDNEGGHPAGIWDAYLLADAYDHVHYFVSKSEAVTFVQRWCRV